MNETENAPIKKSAMILGLRIGSAIFLTQLVLALMSIAVLRMQGSAVSVGVLSLALLLLYGIELMVTAYIVLALTATWAGNTAYLNVNGCHLLVVHNFVHRHQKLYELNNLRSVNMKQSWLGKQFNYGTIELFFAFSGYQQRVVLTDIYDPRHYETMLEGFLEQHQVVNGSIQPVQTVHSQQPLAS